METIRVGVVGLGSMGRKHLETLSRTPCVKVTAIVTRSESKHAEAVANFGVTAVADYRELVGLVDAVVIAVPTVLHAEMAKFYMALGIHVLLEKPIAPTVAEARDLVQAADQAGVVFMVGHIERFNPAYRRLQEIIGTRTEPQGKILVRGYRMGTYDARSQDIGVELDLMIHDVDALAGLFPQWTLQLQQALGMAVVSPLPDIAVTQLTFTQEEMVRGSAVLMANRIADARRRCMTIEYDGFKAELDFMNQTLQVHEGDKVEDIPVEKAFPLDGELMHFVTCIREHGAPATDGNAALRALDICRRAGELIMGA